QTCALPIPAAAPPPAAAAPPPPPAAAPAPAARVAPPPAAAPLPTRNGTLRAPGMGVVEHYGVDVAKANAFINSKSPMPALTPNFQPAPGGARPAGAYFELPPEAGGGHLMIPGATQQQMYQYFNKVSEQLPGIKLKNFEQAPGAQAPQSTPGRRGEAPVDPVGSRLQQLAQSPAAQAYAQGGVPLPPERPRDLNMQRAQSEMRLSPQESALYQRHLDNLYGPGGFDHPNGARSSLLRMSTEADGRTYNIPSVYEGRQVSGQEALRRASEQGFDKFPSYPTRGEADRRYNQMHQFMDRDTSDYRARNPPAPAQLPPQVESQL